MMLQIVSFNLNFITYRDRQMEQEKDRQADRQTDRQ
jgi:hypothetical protein